MCVVVDDRHSILHSELVGFKHADLDYDDGVWMRHDGATINSAEPWHLAIS